MIRALQLAFLNLHLIRRHLQCDGLCDGRLYLYLHHGATEIVVAIELEELTL